MPRIPPILLNCTFYLYATAEDARRGEEYGGTGFIVGVPSELLSDRVTYLYGISTWHVACRDGASIVRLHRKDGGIEIRDFGPEDWDFIPGGADIAAISLSLDQSQLRFAYIAENAFATREQVEKHGIGVGENVFMLGRFIDHDGGERNAPAARFGNISIMPDGTIRQPTGARQESYCLDMHSRTGFSGSPAFVYRTPGNDFTKDGINLTERFLYLLGVHWGQFPERWEIGADVDADAAEVARQQSLVLEGKHVKGLSGMTLVSPAWRIREVLNLPKFKEERRRSDEIWKQRLKESLPDPNAESTANPHRDPKQ